MRSLWQPEIIEKAAKQIKQSIEAHTPPLTGHPEGTSISVAQNLQNMGFTKKILDSYCNTNVLGVLVFRKFIDRLERINKGKGIENMIRLS